ncbi:MAG TPA: hypothetical protein DHW71_15060 [Gammaproteobacteria bacterium]|nr:hypothetical protein [Gammaproteobacteria bacterium]HCK94313.1 hypothetical protein [Gammaproteobacteria bacterium]
MTSSSIPQKMQYIPVNDNSQLEQSVPNKGRRLDFDGSTHVDAKFNNANGDLSKIRVVVPPLSIVTINLTMSDNTNRTITFENVSETESMPGRLYLGQDGHIGVAEGIDTHKDDNGRSIPSLPSIFGKHSTSREIKLLFQNSVDPVNFKTSTLSNQFPGFRLDTKKIKPRVTKVDVEKELLAERREKDEITRTHEKAKKIIEQYRDQIKAEGEDAVSVDYDESEAPSRDVVDPSALDVPPPKTREDKQADLANRVNTWREDVSESNTLERQESTSSKASEYFECKTGSEVNDEPQPEVKDDKQHEQAFKRVGHFNIPTNTNTNSGQPKRPTSQIF